MDSEEDFAALAPFYGINLNNRTVRPAFQERKIVLIGAPDPAGTVHFERIMRRLSGPVRYLSGKVNVFGRKDTGIYVIINSFFGKHDL